MPTNFPTNLDTLTNPVATDNTVTVSHAGQHANANDAIEALEAKVGADASAVTTSHDYKLSGVTGSDKAASLAASENLTNKNLGVGTKITLGSDATGDIWYRHSDGTIKRLAVGADGKILKLASGVPVWDTEVTVADASTDAKGIVEEATLAEIDANTAAGGTSARLFVNPSTLGKSVDTTLADDSDAKIPSQHAVKTYVDGRLVIKNGVATYDMTTASGTQTIAHGLGKAPSVVRLRGILPFGASSVTSVSDGIYNGTTNSCVWNNAAGSAGAVNGNTTNAIYLEYTGNYRQTGIVTVDATNITITWTKAGTPTGTAQILWEAQ